MSSRALRLIIATAIAACLLVAAAIVVGRVTAPTANATPVAQSAEAGFARDMQVHHDQAVQMAMIVRDSTDDEEIRSLSYDIATSQAQQSGQMYGWLASWGLAQNSAQPRMSWMADAEHSHNTSTLVSDNPGLMPGMATDQQLAELRELTGVAADRLFLELMIEHHRAGVDMSEAILERSTNQVVGNLAQSIVTAQTGEILYMNQLLDAR